MEQLLLLVLQRACRTAVRALGVALFVAGALGLAAALTGCRSGSSAPHSELLPPSRGVIVPARLYDSEQVIQLLVRADPDVQAIFGNPAVFTWDTAGSGTGGRQGTLYPLGVGSKDERIFGRAMLRADGKSHAVTYTLTERNDSGAWEISSLDVTLTDQKDLRTGVIPRRKVLAGDDPWRAGVILAGDAETSGAVIAPKAVVIEPGASAEAEVLKLLAADTDVCALFGGKPDFTISKREGRGSVAMGQSTLYPLIGPRDESRGTGFYIEGAGGRQFFVEYFVQRHNSEPWLLTGLVVSLLDDATHQTMPHVSPEQKRLVGTRGLIGPLRATDQEIKAWQQEKRVRPSGGAQDGATPVTSSQ